MGPTYDQGQCRGGCSCDNDAGDSLHDTPQSSRSRVGASASAARRPAAGANRTDPGHSLCVTSLAANGPTETGTTVRRKGQVQLGDFT
jgi:hypothetical protein